MTRVASATPSMQMTGYGDWKGQGTGCSGHANGCGNVENRGGKYYQTRPEITKVCMSKELKVNVFNYGRHSEADMVRVTEEIIHQYVVIKCDKYIVNEIINTIPLSTLMTLKQGTRSGGC